MIKVCHVTSAHNSYDDRIFYKECVSLSEAGYDTYLVARGESREEKGVHVIGVGEAPESRIQRMTGFSKTIYHKALEINADLYHLHDPELLPYGLKLKKAGKVVVFDSHENYYTQILDKKYLPSVIRKIVASMFYKYETRVVKEIDATIVPCTFDGVNIFENRAKKTCIISNVPLLTDFYNKYDENVNKVYDVCYVGGLTYDRGIYHLVKATAAANCKLFLAGQFSPAEFEETVKKLPEFSNVEYAGYLPNNEIYGVIQSCHLGANLLLNVGQYHHIDTFGVKVYEYMSMGIPVLMPNYPYAKKMVDKYNFGICVDPENIDEVAKSINYLISHHEESRRMGENGRSLIVNEMNWDKEKEKLVKIYAEILH